MIEIMKKKLSKEQLAHRLHNPKTISDGDVCGDLRAKLNTVSAGILNALQKKDTLVVASLKVSEEHVLLRLKLCKKIARAIENTGDSEETCTEAFHLSQRLANLSLNPAKAYKKLILKSLQVQKFALMTVLMKEKKRILAVSNEKEDLQKKFADLKIKVGKAVEEDLAVSSCSFPYAKTCKTFLLSSLNICAPIQLLLAVACWRGCTGRGGRGPEGRID